MGIIFQHLSAFDLNARDHESRMRIKMSVCKHYRLDAPAVVGKCQYVCLGCLSTFAKVNLNIQST